MKNGLRGLSRGLRRLAWACCALLMLFTLGCVFLNQHGLNRKAFDFSNAAYAVCAAVLAFGAYAATRRWNDVRRDRRWIALGCVGVFLLQRFITRQIVFGTGWDAVDIVNFGWRIATGGECTDWENLYLSNYTNNKLMILLYAAVIRLRMLFGAELVRLDVLLALTTVNSLIAAATGYLVYRCAEMIAREKRTALIAWLLYVGLIGLSPWFLIPYSDSLALFFPILILFVYFKAETGRGRWPLIGALSYLGFQVKPSVFIVLIAIAIREALCALGDWKREGGLLIRRMAAVLAAMLIMHAGYLGIPDEAFGWNVDREQRLSMPHYLMMGLNTEKLGGYFDRDVAYSCSFRTKAERTRANLEEAARRLEAMGPAGYLRFLSEKNTVNFHDGTFAWGQEGGFMRVVFDVEQTRVIRLLRSLYYPDYHPNGDRHHHLMNLLQMLWMGTLLGQAFSMMSRRAGEREPFVLHLCFAGILLFTLIFESRARYLYVFAPMMIAAACIGYESAAAGIGALFQKNIKKT